MSEVEICSLPYLNRMASNVLSVEENSLEMLYENVKYSQGILVIAAGRSKLSAIIPLTQLGYIEENHRLLIQFGTATFPWGDVYFGLENIRKRLGLKRILLLAVSGSGETKYTLRRLERALEFKNKYPEETDFVAITSNPNSSIGKLAKKYGSLLILKGREKRGTFRETGIMGDTFENGVSVLHQGIVQGLAENYEINKLYKWYERFLFDVGREIEQTLDSEFYRYAVNCLVARSNVFLEAEGVGDLVLYQFGIRLSHIKRCIGDEVHFRHPPTPRPSDVQFTVSCFGSTKSVIEDVKTFRKFGGVQFSIVGKRGTELEENSDFVLYVPEEAPYGKPRTFYTRTALRLSPLPIVLIEELKARGANLTEEILKYHHSVTKP